MAVQLVLNGKSRISVCNAIDKVLLHRNIPDLKIKVKELIDQPCPKRDRGVGPSGGRPTRQSVSR